MSEYNRFTTAKGNLLLNIAPPQNQYNPTPAYHHSIPNPNTLNASINAQPHQPDQSKFRSSNGGYGYTSQPKVIRESRENKNSSGYFEEGRQRQKREQQRVNEQNSQIKEETNASKCCFPGFWLLILVLAVVAATLLIFFLKNKGIFQHSVTSNTSPSVNASQESFSSVSQSQLNSNSTQSLSTPSPPQQNTPISPVQLQPIPVPANPNSPVSEEEESSITSFQFPIEEKQNSPLNEETEVDEVKSIPIPVEQKQYETSYMIPKAQNHRHFLRRNILH